MTTDNATIQKWFGSHIDKDWDSVAVRVSFDDDEILVVVGVKNDDDELPEQADDRELAIKQIARRFHKSSKLHAWRSPIRCKSCLSEKCPGVCRLVMGYTFTHVTAPAMTQLRMGERRVLDTLANSGVATSRSEALTWCVKFVKDIESDWLGNLRDAFESVKNVRNDGQSITKS